MSILRFDPFRDPFREVDRLASQLVSGTRTPLGMAMDAWKSDDGYHVELDLPGIDPQSIDLTCERNSLTVRAERRPSFGPDDEVIVAERPQGNFTRQLVLGEGLDTGAVEASYDSGVLHLTIPVAQAAQSRRIEISQRQRGAQHPTIEGTSAPQDTNAGGGQESGAGPS